MFVWKWQTLQRESTVRPQARVILHLRILRRYSILSHSPYSTLQIRRAAAFSIHRLAQSSRRTRIERRASWKVNESVSSFLICFLWHCTRVKFQLTILNEKEPRPWCHRIVILVRHDWNEIGFTTEWSNSLKRDYEDAFESDCSCRSLSEKWKAIKLWLQGLSWSFPVQDADYFPIIIVQAT